MVKAAAFASFAPREPDRCLGGECVLLRRRRIPGREWERSWCCRARCTAAATPAAAPAPRAALRSLWELEEVEEVEEVEEERRRRRIPGREWDRERDLCAPSTLWRPPAEDLEEDDARERERWRRSCNFFAAKAAVVAVAAVAAPIPAAILRPRWVLRPSSEPEYEEKDPRRRRSSAYLCAARPAAVAPSAAAAMWRPLCWPPSSDALEERERARRLCTS